MLGLRGSGSHSIVVEPTEVPHDWVVPVNFADVRIPQDTPGGALHGNPMYAGRGIAYFCGELVAIAVGLGFAALDEYEHALHSKLTTFTRIPRWQDDLYRQHYGTALALLRGARAIVLEVADEHLALSRRGFEGGEPFSLAEDHDLAMMTHRAGDMVFQAVDRIVRTSGASGMVDGQRMQRYWRDVTMFRGHMGMHLEMHAAAGAAAILEASAPA
jgi:3-hydroxy-9,10-secoandrosta-1,3,5(10)-triene-9,17-dione monooxygenase